MKKLIKRLEMLIVTEVILIFLLLLFIIIFVVFVGISIKNNVSAIIINVLICGCIAVHTLQNATLIKFFQKGCQTGENVFLYYGVKLHMNKAFNQLLPGPLAGIFFCQTSEKNYIYVVYKDAYDTDLYRFSDITTKHEVKRIRISNLASLDSYIDIF